MAAPQKQQDIVIVKSKNVFCDGTSEVVKDPTFGHPGVYLKIDHTFVECTYCNRRFVYQDDKDK